MVTTDSRKRREASGDFGAGQAPQASWQQRAADYSKTRSDPQSSDYSKTRSDPQSSGGLDLNTFIGDYLQPLLAARGETSAAYEASHRRSMDHHKAAFDSHLSNLSDLEKRAKLGRFAEDPDEAQHWSGVLGSVPRVRSNLSYRFEEQLQDELNEYSGFKARQQQELLGDIGFFDTAAQYFSPESSGPTAPPPEAPDQYEWQAQDASGETQQWLGPVPGDDGQSQGPALFAISGLTDSNAAEFVSGHLTTYAGTGDFEDLIGNINKTIDTYRNPDNFVNPETGLPDGEAFSAASQVASQLRNTLNVLISSHQANQGSIAQQQQSLYARQTAQYQDAQNTRQRQLSSALADLLGQTR